VVVVKNTFVDTVDTGGSISTLSRRRAKSASSASESAWSCNSSQYTQSGSCSRFLDADSTTASNSSSLSSSERMWMKPSQPVTLLAWQAGMRGSVKEASSSPPPIDTQVASPTFPDGGHPENMFPTATQLDDLEETDVAESSSLPSAGSELHELGKCNPCLFFFRGNCVKGTQCEYCHLVHEGQTNNRIRPSKQTRMALKEKVSCAPKTARTRCQQRGAKSATGAGVVSSSGAADCASSASTERSTSGSPASAGPPGCWAMPQPLPQLQQPELQQQDPQKQNKQSPQSRAAL